MRFFEKNKNKEEGCLFASFHMFFDQTKKLAVSFINFKNIFHYKIFFFNNFPKKDF